MSVHIAILVSARWLVPRSQRAEWFAEWDAELCYIRRACHSRALAFCLGAYKDAFWLRRQCPYRLLDSPLQCLALLAIVAAISLLSAGRAVLTSPFRDARGLVELKDTTIDRYDAIWKKAGPVFAGFAFYRRVDETVRSPRGMAILSVIRGTRNLFQVLNVPIAASADGPVLVVSRDVWQWDFDNDRRIAGHFLEIGGRPVPVAGVIAEDAWPLADHVDAWLLEDSTPPHSKGSLVGRVAAPGIAPTILPRPARRFRDFIGVFTLAMLACLIVTITTSLKYGVAPGFRPRAFLLAKAALIVATVYCWALLGFSLDTVFSPILGVVVVPGSMCAFYWAVTDQRRRCPVCLRFLSGPVLLGKASQTFLGWYGTERMCALGHGVLRVPELSTSCFDSQQWLNLEELCAKV